MTARSLLSSSETALRVADEVHSALSGESTGARRIRGAGLWLNSGAPVAATRSISLEHDSGIVEYVPGDLTLTALAGTPLSKINEVVAQDRQWLALDPFGDSRGTIGATIATASSGPLSQMFGTPRDQLLGVEFVTGNGDIVRGGGRVTKNVAGFDLSRLVCGSWGTIGVITEVTLRLRALPDADVTLAIPAGGSPTELAALLTRVRDAAISPAALELLDAHMCAALAIGMKGALLVRFCGNEPGVRAQTSRLAAVAPGVIVPGDVWEHLSTVTPAKAGAHFTPARAGVHVDDAMVLRLSSRPTRLPDVWEFATNLANHFDDTSFHASVGRGIVRINIPARWADQLPEILKCRPECSIVFERLPAHLWPILATHDVMNDRLNRGVRDAFDPRRILNPGIMGGLQT